MPIIKSEGCNFVNFIHIPKTGGTTIERCFDGCKINYSDGVFDSFIKVTPQHFDRDIFKYIGIESITDKSFAVVREPMDRLVSEYFHFQKAHGQKISFDAFCILFLYLYKKDSYTLDNHIKPQSKFVLDDTVVYKFEDGFDSIFDKISNDFKLPLVEDLTVENKGKKKPFHMGDCFHNIVIDFYHDDYELFDYVKPEKIKVTTFETLVSFTLGFFNLSMFFAGKLSRKAFGF
ncbi:sulfotransferase family 2 domain-containing protein [Vibrio sp. 10N.286.49.F3]|uniref:sulfotransferase family 2 domain-containing protein n=1 Tax=Vibrio sp. 10N.286.49.F3 TaxID=3229704 RepID=UPI00354B8A3F